MRLYDTLARQVRELVPQTPGRLGMYSCGPTVYRSVHIGNLRTYLLADWIKRTAQAEGLEVRHVKNITDVGHMRQEAAERGGDKVIAAALAAGKSPAEIARQFESEFHEAEQLLGIIPADVFPRATDHISPMLELVERLLKRDAAYVVDGTVYFDTGAHPGYGRLSGNSLDELSGAAAAETDPGKRRPSDFTLWRSAEAGRQLMVWDSPFGRGFPGWHIECSAMSMAYLGEEFDLHTGGVDNIFPHHEDELAQSQAATGRAFARHWVHGQHLLADGVKMAKSQGNVYTLDDLVRRGFDPLAFRLLCATVGYRARLNFTLASLAGAERALQRLRRRACDDGGSLDEAAVQGLRDSCQERLSDNLDLPGALARIWRFANDRGRSGRTRRAALLSVDVLLGLGLDRPPTREPRDGAWTAAARQREEARRAGKYSSADACRPELLHLGVVPEDSKEETHYRKATALDHRRGLISSPLEVLDQRFQPDLCEVSVSLVVSGYPADVDRCLRALEAHRGHHRVEVLAVDNDADPQTSDVLRFWAERVPSVRVFRADHRLGEAAARNVTLRAARGTVLLLLDTGVEASGPWVQPLLQALRDPLTGAAGRWGARTTDLREFFDSDALEVDAIDGYCLGLRRERLRQLGFLDERFRFYRLLDFDLSMSLRAAGLINRRYPELPFVMHEHRGWEESEPEERERLSRLNFRRFYDRWHHRQDLLLAKGAADRS